MNINHGLDAIYWGVKCFTWGGSCFGVTYWVILLFVVSMLLWGL